METASRELKITGVHGVTLQGPPEPKPPAAAESPTRTNTIEPDTGYEHLLTFKAPLVEGDEENAHGMVPADPAPSAEGAASPAAEPAKKISKAQFWGTFQLVFAAPGRMLHPRFKPLAIQPEEQEFGRSASDAGYELAEEFTPWLIEQKSSRLANILTLLAFLGAKVQISAIIAAEMRAERAEAQRQAQGWNQPEAPSTAAGEGPEPPAGDGSPMGWLKAERVEEAA